MRWKSTLVTQLFGEQLVRRVLSFAIPINDVLDVRVWRSMCSLRVRDSMFMLFLEVSLLNGMVVLGSGGLVST